MKTVDNPEMIIVMKMVFLVSGGKFRKIFADDQSSTRREDRMRIGIVSRLL